MRGISLLLTGAALASCTTPPPSPTRAATAEAHLEHLLAGKVAQRPVSCLPPFPTEDMTVIDENTIVYRMGANELYVAHMEGPCTNLGSPNYILVTRSVGGTSQCRGDIARIMDSSSRMIVGSCAFGEIVPYKTAGR